MKKRFRKIIVLGACLLVTLLAQNCGVGEFSSNSNDQLAKIHSSSILDLNLPVSKARLGDRIFIASVFAEVFLPQNGAELSKVQAIEKWGGGENIANIHSMVTSSYDSKFDKVLSDIIIDNVLKKNIEFHGACSFIDGDGTCAIKRDNATRRVAEASLLSVAPGSVTREGYRLSTCKYLISEERAIRNFVLNISGKRNTKFSLGHIMDIYDAFYPDQKIYEEAYNSLVDVADAALSGGESDDDVWRAVITSVCYSSGWQIP